MRDDAGRTGPNGENLRHSAAAAPTAPGEPASSTDWAVKPPVISLPKGGGAVRGIGEKFAANPVTGTAAMSVPIATSPGRAGFGPQLALTYDSGAGNGPFGFGWSLGLPNITRKKDKGLPQYRDAVESDVYLLSGAEDLVPVMEADGRRFVDLDTHPGYAVHRYRPRVEGLFARIERWTHQMSGEIHWRSISRDNVTSAYGWGSTSRIYDPADPDPARPARIFSWLLCESHDDKGNAVVYEYVPEDDRNVAFSQSNERNRERGANRYLKRIKYGNRVSRLVQPDLAAMEWLFEVVFDYDEGHHVELALDPGQPAAEQHRRVRASAAAGAAWNVRPDSFSVYYPGFEVRTHRRCRRVLMFHRFPELTRTQAGEPCLVRSTEFDYADLSYAEPVSVDRQQEHQGSSRFASFLRSVSQSSYLRDESLPVEDLHGVSYAAYLKRSLPPLELEYTKARIQDVCRTLDADSFENLPTGIDGEAYRWVDLDGEGVSGILTEQGSSWFYKPNLGAGRFGAMRALPSMPSAARLGAGGTQLLDLAGNGRLDVVAFEGALPGYYQRTDDEDWQPFRRFSQLPNIRWDQPNLRLVDLNGDGHADVLITEHEVFTWYPSRGEEGFAAGRHVPQPTDDERGPRLVLADGTQSIYLADLCGDGLSDLVRIRNGEVCYWPSLGHGRFGPKVTMDDSPCFDHPDHFDQRRIRLADVDGSGTTDIVYLHRDGVRIYFNQSGNRWSVARTLAHLPPIDNLSSVMTADLLGNGTACLVWSSPLAGEARRPLRYVDLMGGQKPHLLVRARNNLGAETEVEYVASTHFYLADKRAGTPWVTKLPFPVHCVAKVTARDRWRGTSFSTTYSYHHGYFDGPEREFRGFGRVEQVDVESFGTFAAGNEASPYITGDKRLFQPPVKTITWYDTGALLARRRAVSQFEREYFPASFEALNPGESNVLGGFRENALPEPDMPADALDATERREALRACKGMTLRQEIYELDLEALERGEHRPVKLFSAAYHNCHVRRLQPRGENRHAVFLVTESEAVTYHYELDLRDATVLPDPRVAHTLNLNVDDYGHVLQSASVVYPRLGRHTDPSLPASAEDRIAAVQGELHLAYTETRFTGDVSGPDDHRLRVPCEVRTYELAGIRPDDERHFTLAELRAFRLSSVYQAEGVEVPDIPYHEVTHHRSPQKRLVEHVRTLFFDDDLSDARPPGELHRLGLPYETYKLALTEDLLAAIFTAGQLTDEVRAELNTPASSGYLGGPALLARFPDAAGQYWIRSGVAGFDPDAPSHFYLPERYTDPFGNLTQLRFDSAHDLFLQSSTDALGNTTSIEAFDFRVLAPRLTRDVNDNLSEVVFDILGIPVAMAVRGKGHEADDLDGFAVALVQPVPGEAARLFSDSYAEALLRRLLDHATARYVYSFGETSAPDGSVTYGHAPPAACTILREQHVAQLPAGEVSPLQVAFEYSDGAGNLLVTKVQAEPEAGHTELRWLANGKTVLNNKGKAVKQYEPYFSASEHRFEEPAEVGVTPVMYYDAAGRLIRTEQPDGSYSRVEFSPWQVTAYDPNDTHQPGDAWYANRLALTVDEGDRLALDRAAAQTATHANTPTAVFLDSLGREVVSVAHNRYLHRRGSEDAATLVDEKYTTFTKLDAEGKPLWIRDARSNLVIQYIAPPMPDSERVDRTDSFAPCYDIAGNLLFQHSMDAGDRWMLGDAAGKPLYAWDVNDRVTDSGAATTENRRFRTLYDALHRPTERHLTLDGAPPQVIERFVYGEHLTDVDDGRARNLRGQVHTHHDPSGVVTNVRFDFKGNLLEATRNLASAYREPVIDWAVAAPEDEPFRQFTQYDALNRMAVLFSWHRRREGAAERIAVYEPHYNQRGLLAREDIYMHAQRAADGRRVGGLHTAALVNIGYDAKGQRELIHYGNGTTTRYHYDPFTFRLSRQRSTRRGHDPRFPDDRLKSPLVLQDLYYVYDPVGNITDALDNAYEPAFFNNQRVEAHSRYTYDSLYRLLSASGREHYHAHGAPGQLEEAPWVQSFPISDQALRDYTQVYRYDEAGNIRAVRHQADRGNWTRSYRYLAHNNRLEGTTTGNGDDDVVDYRHDTHGSLLNLDASAEELDLRWDYRDMVRSLNLGGGGWAYYNYDFARQRTRKVITNLRGTKQWERFYLGGMEVYRRYGPRGVVEEIETHHLFVDDQRVAIIEDIQRTNDAHLAEGVLFRYQYSNHLGSAALELDSGASVISYEEYHPYGTTAYHATGSGVRAVKKRYRYTGMERDEESGLSYHTTRYYAPWLARWASADPIGIISGTNLYEYSSSSPTTQKDPGGTQPLPGAVQRSPTAGPAYRQRFSGPEYEADRREMALRSLGSQFGQAHADLQHLILNPPPQQDEVRSFSPRTGVWYTSQHADALTVLREAGAIVADDEGHLAPAFLSDPAFRAQYESSAAFREGYNSSYDAERDFQLTAEGVDVALRFVDLAFAVVGAGFSLVRSLWIRRIADSAARIAARLGRTEASAALRSELAAADEIADFLPSTASRGATAYGPARLEVLRRHLDQRGVDLVVGDEFLRPGASGAFSVPVSGRPQLILGSEPSEYQVLHELAHYVQYRRLGRAAYLALERSAEFSAPEQFVFDRLEHHLRWRRLSDAERDHAIRYIEGVLTGRPVGFR